jgi:hypothetical protein
MSEIAAGTASFQVAFLVLVGFSVAVEYSRWVRRLVRRTAGSTDVSCSRALVDGVVRHSLLPSRQKVGRAESQVTYGLRG